MSYEFQRVAIVNRGEAAMRFIHAAREFNQEQGASLRTIGLFTEPDRHAMFVREADEAVFLGPAQVLDPSTQQPKSSYVDYARLGRALAQARAEAVWVGWGFVAEHAEFADLCRELGIVFIGPDGDVMRLLGDKITSKLLAELAHLPVAPWSGGMVETVDDAERHAERLGYPLLIKATAGGGGRGIRRVDSAGELAQAFEGARAEAYKAFGDSTVFMEQLIEGARHVEVQIIADHFGTTWAAGVRDCTIQRRHQKILEEAPSPALSPDQDQELREAAVRLSQAAGYHNAGTVEFLYEPESQRFSFMEMNTRLQVEHPVTECTTGLDLVKLQIHVARGGRLEGVPPRTRGHAIEVRLNAEDPDNNFAPAPGAIERFKTPTGPGLRIDTGVAVGDAVPSEFDSMIAKIIAFGQNRQEALARLQRALRESVVVINGGASNKAFLLELLGRTEVKSGQVDIGWLDRLAASGEHLSKSYADVALVQAAIEAYEAELAVEQKQFYAAALRGRPHVRSEVGRTVELRYRGHSYTLRVYRLGPEQYRVEADGSRLDVHIDRLGPFEYWLTGLDRRFHVVSIVQGHSYRIEVDGISHRVDRDEGGMIHAPAPAVVVSIAVKPGDTVEMGDRLAVLEAMKMEMQVVAPFSGKVRQVLTIANVQVGAGTPLVQMEPAGSDDTMAAKDSAVLGASFATDRTGEAAGSRCRRNLRELRQLMLGFDIDPKHTEKILAELSKQGERPVGVSLANGTGVPPVNGHGQDGRGTAPDTTTEAPEESDEIRRGEDEILSIFVDICSLFQRQPEVDGSTGGEAPSSEAYLFSYLRMLETQGEKLPAAFVDALRRVLAHYGVKTLDRSPALEESLLWIYKSHQRVAQQVPTILALLERRLDRIQTVDHISHPCESLAEGRGASPAEIGASLSPSPRSPHSLPLQAAGGADAPLFPTAGAASFPTNGEKSRLAPELAAEDSFRTLLDRMISITRGLSPAVSDLAREVRYRCFDQPLFEQARKQVYAKAEVHLAYLAADPEAADRDERVRKLVECPQPLVGLLCGRFAAADRGLRGLMLEVMTRRYYRVKLLNFRSLALDGQSYVSAEYDEEGRRVHIFTAHAEFSRLAEAVRTLAPLIAEVPATHDIVIDFYLWHSGLKGDAEATQREVHSLLNLSRFPRSLRRIVAVVAGPGAGQGMGGLQHFTYRPGEKSYEEEKLYRGLHPMMGKRLSLWRLNNFHLQRLPSVEDIYLFHAIAHDNPKDERLFACAEVRDLTPVRDESGRVVKLPHLERMLAEALAGIRLFQSRRPLHERLYWNRILLYAWPPLTLKAEELHAIVNRLAPEAEGLGLEQVVVRGRIPHPETGELRDMQVRISNPGGRGMLMTFRPATKLQPLKPLREYDLKVVRMRQRGLIYPYEIIKMLTPGREVTRGEFPPVNLSSTTWARKGASFLSIVPTAKTRPTLSSASFATLPRSIPRA
jgi:acetyl/propionyl-CoA carboxylase alpha subunit